jgi:hypothetical protein
MSDLYRIYIDDSGNVDAQTTNKSDVRFGSITAVILNAAYQDTTFNPGFEKLSIRHFGERDGGGPHNIHRRALAKPPSQGPFAVLQDEEARKAWDAAALKMFDSADYVVVTACVDKVEWYHRYPTWDGDFYEVLVLAALERSFYFLKNRNGVAEVNIENKNPSKDARIKSAYRRVLDNGSDHIPGARLQSTFTSVEPNFVKKDHCVPGAQLADLLAAPALQHIRHIHTRRDPIGGTFTKQVADILEDRKFYREAGKGPAGYGRLWRPQT